jgi:Malectin domain
MNQITCLSAIFLMGLATSTATLKTIYAVNSAGPAFHDPVTGIDYQSDMYGEGVNHVWPNHVEIGGVENNQLPIYRTVRYDKKKFGYNLPIDGDGDYALLLEFSDDQTSRNVRVMDVVLNNAHTVLKNFDIPWLSGHRMIWNEVIYFSICAGQLYFQHQTSTVINSAVRLEFVSVKFWPHVAAVVLFKGEAGEGKPIIGTRTVIFFDPNGYSCSPPRQPPKIVLDCPDDCPISTSFVCPLENSVLDQMQPLIVFNISNFKLHVQNYGVDHPTTIQRQTFKAT